MTKKIKRTWIKIFISITSIIVFTILFFVWIYYFNIFEQKTKKFSIGTESFKNIEKIPKTITTTKRETVQTKVDLIKKISKSSNDTNNNKQNVKKEQIIKQNNKINLKKINKRIMKKIFYLSQDKRNFYFIIKFINRDFLIFKEWREIYYLNLWKDDANINIRKDYKTNINYIYNKQDLVNDKILKFVNNLIAEKKIKDNTDLWNNLRSFLSRFMSLKSNYYIYGSDIKKSLNMRIRYRHPLYWSIWTSFNINRIIFINSLYQWNTNLWLEINKYVKDKYNNILFINFTKKELDFFNNYFFNRIIKNKDNNYYDIYKINISNYKDFLTYIILKKITYYMEHKSDKDNNDELKLLIKKSKILYTLTYSYYRQIKKYRQINSFDIKQIMFVGDEIQTLPLQKKDKIEKIMWNITKLLLIDNIPNNINNDKKTKK